MKTPVAIICTILITGCVSIPYPHRAYHYSHVSGRVVDRITKEPLENINVRLAYVTMTTKRDGLFEFVPETRQHFVFNLPLFPFDFWDACGDQLHLNDWDVVRNRNGSGYRSVSIGVDSCPYPFLGAMKREENLLKFDRLGDIELMRAK